ncbi:MAG: aminotransferase class I/II-fold pyridoxal phosphate-dependent enzyme [Candidatus Accumulibacter sp.]|uniref:aminotransferase class I/II-fold pyridoxal phosphate-dependent enzyme n=1 Tax=Accumulibacter sp. TaxID=2053492 RepID=UPI002879AF92|nr:aminotransferase class I/II-fold pyridoxal phosphate-dependent enzyme [Accumulibacter sp.]MDS4016558.1 aminotransferase class I/II-fold pyridoxal phosphate-dependent enzyme [Accumulibacter sp.]
MASGFGDLLATMRRNDGAGTRRMETEQPKYDTEFSTLPIYQQMVFQREFAAFAGFKNPYYRIHDERAGAHSRIEGRPVINFASYDYLGLNGHPEVIAASEAATRQFGTSVSASRISAGERQVHRDLELALAANYDAEDCIVFVSGHASAISTIATLLGPKDLILHDAVIHNCIVVGAQLSGATRRNFAHNDLDHLEAMLQGDRSRFNRVMIVSEGLFSMDGDGPDLARLVEIKEKYGAWLMMDDAHALGVLGKTGRGIFEAQGVDPRRVDMWLGTLSKSLVSCGGYVAGSSTLVDILKHQAPGFVYSVGMPAGNAAAAAKALEMMQREPERVERLQSNSRAFREQARAAGLDVAQSWGVGVIPVIVGETVRTVLLAEKLLARGINAFPILPPGVPEKSARLRFFINATHTPEEITQTVQLVAEEMAAIEGVTLSSIRKG